MNADITDVVWIPLKQKTLARIFQMRVGAKPLDEVLYELCNQENLQSRNGSDKPAKVRTVSSGKYGGDLTEFAKQVLASPQLKRRYLHDILEGLVEFRPTYWTHRSKVIARVTEIRRNRGATIPRTIEATVQHMFKVYCGDSDNFHGKQSLNLFCWPRGKFEGTWGLNIEIAKAFLMGLERQIPPRIATPCLVTHLSLDVTRIVKKEH